MNATFKPSRSNFLVQAARGREPTYVPSSEVLTGKAIASGADDANSIPLVIDVAEKQIMGLSRMEQALVTSSVN